APLERLLASLWGDVLGADPIGADDDFFELGGHSLQAAQLAARVSDATGRDIPVQFIILHPTVRAAAAALEADPGDRGTLLSPARAGALPAGDGGPSPLVTVEHRSLLSLFAARKIAPVDAAALTYF